MEKRDATREKKTKTKADQRVNGGGGGEPNRFSELNERHRTYYCGTLRVIENSIAIIL